MLEKLFTLIYCELQGLQVSVKSGDKKIFHFTFTFTSFLLHDQVNGKVQVGRGGTIQTSLVYSLPLIYLTPCRQTGVWVFRMGGGGARQGRVETRSRCSACQSHSLPRPPRLVDQYCPTPKQGACDTRGFKMLVPLTFHEKSLYNYLPSPLILLNKTALQLNTACARTGGGGGGD